MSHLLASQNYDLIKGNKILKKSTFAKVLPSLSPIRSINYSVRRQLASDGSLQRAKNRSKLSARADAINNLSWKFAPSKKANASWILRMMLVPRAASGRVRICICRTLYAPTFYIPITHLRHDSDLLVYKIIAQELKHHQSLIASRGHIICIASSRVIIFKFVNRRQRINKRKSIKSRVTPSSCFPFTNFFGTTQLCDALAMERNCGIIFCLVASEFTKIKFKQHYDVMIHDPSYSRSHVVRPKKLALLD